MAYELGEAPVGACFLSAAFDLGFAYVRPQVAFGYGRPHWSWIGLEAWPLAGAGGLGMYSGVRAALPNFSIRGGPVHRSLRGGVIGSVVMTAHLEAQASFIPVLVSPDSIGLAGGDFGQLGVRFRWATDAPLDDRRTDSL